MPPIVGIEGSWQRERVVSTHNLELVHDLKLQDGTLLRQKVTKLDCHAFFLLLCALSHDYSVSRSHCVFVLLLRSYLLHDLVRHHLILNRCLKLGKQGALV